MRVTVNHEFLANVLRYVRISAKDESQEASIARSCLTTLHAAVERGNRARQREKRNRFYALRLRIPPDCPVKIQVIKAVRELTGASLLPAKEAVEAAWGDGVYLRIFAKPFDLGRAIGLIQAVEMENPRLKGLFDVWSGFAPVRDWFVIHDYVVTGGRFTIEAIEQAS